MARDWTEARRKVEREAECRLCGSQFALQAAHTIHRSIGGGMSEDAIVPLCRSCHEDYDDHRVDILHALTYAEQAEAVRVIGMERARRRFVPSEYANVIRFPGA